MVYNKKYDRWFSKEGLMFRYDSKQDKLILCKQHKNKFGYVLSGSNKIHSFLLHRAIYETFIGEIPEGYVIDHINTIKDDNRLSNLRCVTPIENSNNPLTKVHLSENRTDKVYSDFGEKFKAHYGITRLNNVSLYTKEHMWYSRHNRKCRWEVDNECN